MSVTLADGVVVTVEIGFSTSAGSGTVPLNSTFSSITWTDVSADVRSLSIRRGRSSELDRFTTGSASVVFGNADRKYDPEYSAGTYYGKLTPGRPIRIKAQPSGGSTSSIFFGFVDQWNQQYAHPSEAIATVTASDAFKMLNLVDLPSYWEYRIRADGPTHWFRFDDGSTPSRAFDTVTGGSQGSWRLVSTGAETVGASTSSLVSGDSSVSAQFDGTKFVEFPDELFAFNINDATAKTIEFWMQTSTTANGSYGILYKPGYEFTLAVGMSVSGGVGTLQGQVGSVGGPNLATAFTSTVQVNDGRPHHVVLRSSSSTPFDQFWVDGVQATTSASFTTTAPLPVKISVGQGFTSSATSTYNFTSPFTGVIDELVMYETKALSSGDVADHYAIGTGTYLSGQTADARISSLLTMVGWPSDGKNLTTATGTVQAIDTEGKTLLDALQECETADQGRLFIDGAGRVAFISSNALAATATYNTSQRTYGDGTGEKPYTDLEFVYNDQLIKNRVVVGRANGATVTVNDTTSQGQYFIRTDSQSGYINDTDGQVVDIANVRLAVYAQPSLRIQTLGLNPRADTTIYTGLIGDEIGTRITVKRRPQSIGSAISRELLIEGVAHDVAPQGWESIYNLSPVPLPFLVLDDNTFGFLDDFYLS